MNPWDLRALSRAFGAAVLGLVVVWIVTAASDEGQLTAGARASRSLPLAPLCSAVGAALALGTARLREESRAFEALGRSPAETSRAAAMGAALPSLVVAITIAAVPAVDISGFYPRAAHADAFVLTPQGFESTSLGVRVEDDGATTPLELPPPAPDEGLPRGARFAAAGSTALAGLALALVSARAALRRSLLDARLRRRMRATAFAEAIACALFTLILFQAAAVRLVPAAAAVIPPLLLLALALARLRWDFGGIEDRRLT
ncbi:MAG: hypothetical protein KIT84_24175 [Labilithrix sp.]|nr:hypothetical protein [Labilithrix sp.]MCW5814147.1 hypothetical protein [Labilithrix sp.]